MRGAVGAGGLGAAAGSSGGAVKWSKRTMRCASSSAVAAKPMFAYSFPPTTVAPESKGPAKQSSATPSPVAGPVVPSEVAASQARQSQPVTKSPETVPDTRPLTTTEDTDSSTDHTD